MNAPRFELVRTNAGWHNRFIASNGRTVWTTEVYTRRASAENAVVLLLDALGGHFGKDIEVREIDDRYVPPPVMTGLVHTHGPTVGGGLDCPERRVDGQLRGACIRDDDVRLLSLAAHLDSTLSHRLTELVRADSQAQRYVEVEHRAQRAEDLVAEMRRQMRSLERQVNRLRTGAPS